MIVVASGGDRSGERTEGQPGLREGRHRTNVVQEGGLMLVRKVSVTWLTALMLAVVAAPSCSKKSDDATSDDDKKSKKKKKKSADDDDDSDKKKKKGDDDDDDKKSKKKKKSADDDDDSDKKKKKGDDDDDSDKKKGDDDSSAKKPKGDGPFAASIEGTDLKFKYGKAYASFGGIHVVLSTEKTKCDFAPPSDDAYQVEFDLPPGPGGKFFSGQPVGVATTFNSQKLKLKLTYAYPYQVTANIDSFKAKEGEHVKGSLGFDIKWIETKADTSKKTYAYSGAGNFDVEICSDWQNFKHLEGQPKDPPEGDVEGEYGSEKFKYKTALANVWHDHNNDMDYIESIEFYPSDDVTCSNRWDQWKKVDYFTVRAMGGSGSKGKILGKPQPADPSFSIPKEMTGGKGKMGMSHWFGGGSHRAWVQFDKLEFKGGGAVTGTVYADSASDAKADESGKIGGKFEAKVCSSAF
ncbi:MAG: hypothetical protein ACHREM_20840 [Polyangiales bacterium]